MSKPSLSFGHVSLNAGQAGSGTPQSNSDAFRILVIGDFTGRENAGQLEPETIGQRRLLSIDRDNLEERLQTLQVRLPRTLLTGEGEYVSVNFESLDGFDPDHLFEQLEIFASLRQLRRQLLHPERYQQAMAEIDSWSTANPLALDDEDEPSGSGDTDASDTAVATETNRSSSVTVDQLFDDVLAASQPASDPAVKWQQLIDELVAPYGSAPIPADRDRYVEMLDGAVQRAMRAILHHPHFAALEAAWKSLEYFVKHVETDSRLSLHIVDIAKPELLRDLLTHEELEQSQLHSPLVERTVGTPGGKPWTLVVTTFPFDPQQEAEVAALGRFQQLIAAGQACGCVTVSGESDFWCSAESVGETAWPQLQQLAASRSLVASWPGFLVRLPYGKNTRRTEKFDFEELEPSLSLEQLPLLWGPASILVALDLAMQYSQRQWSLDPGEVVVFEDLPLFVHKVDGESEVREATRCLLSDKQIALCRQQGLTPLVAKKAHNEVLIQGLQSVAQTPAEGAWSRL